MPCPSSPGGRAAPGMWFSSFCEFLLPRHPAAHTGLGAELTADGKNGSYEESVLGSAFPAPSSQGPPPVCPAQGISSAVLPLSIWDQKPFQAARQPVQTPADRCYSAERGNSQLCLTFNTLVSSSLPTPWPEEFLRHGEKQLDMSRWRERISSGGIFSFGLCYSILG